MMNIYFNKKIDTLGRIVIPKEVRQYLNILDQNILTLSVVGDTIVLKKTEGKNKFLLEYNNLLNTLSNKDLEDLNENLDNIIKMYQ